MRINFCKLFILNTLSLESFTKISWLHNKQLPKKFKNDKIRVNGRMPLITKNDNV